MSKVPAPLRNKLLALAATFAIGGAGVGGYQLAKDAVPPSNAVVIAMAIGAHYESSGRHIGIPYVDHIGKGKPLTVCNGITGKEVIAGKYYTEADCFKLELPRYQLAERQAQQRLKYWGTYNDWVKASYMDMIYNLGPGSLDGTTIQRLANAGDLVGACNQMPRWVNGTVNGKLTKLPGLVDRRGTTQELCTQWGTTGHFSVPIKNTKP